MYLKNNTTGKTHHLKSGRGRGGQTHSGEADISSFVNPGDKVQLKFKESRCWSGHRLYWYYYGNMNLKYIPKVLKSQEIFNRSYDQCKKYCTDAGKSLASKQQILKWFNSNTKPGGDVWTPVLDDCNQWLQIGTGPPWAFGKLHSEINGGKYGKPKWGQLVGVQPFKQNFYCSDEKDTTVSPQPCQGDKNRAPQDPLFSTPPIPGEECRQGCKAPRGLSGNCKDVIIGGKSLKKCPYGCPVPSFVRGDTVNCMYDTNCKGCGSKVFPQDAPPAMSFRGLQQRFDKVVYSVRPIAELVL